MNRTILHCDLNCFFASVELLDHPELRDLPVAVCGNPEERHGIILAKNDPAKKFGVKTAETIWQAQKKCPDLILLPPHYDKYHEYSQKVNAIYNQYTDLVEPFGIDESWLDVTGSMHLFQKDGKALADEIRDRVKRELGLTLSVGVSFNKIFAKLGSDYKKPDATTVIAPDNWKDIVFPLPVGDLLFVGHAAQEVLSRFGVKTIGDLAVFPQESLEQLMGKSGFLLHTYANGLDDSPVCKAGFYEPPKSIGNGRTFRENIVRPEDAKVELAYLADEVATRLRKEGLCCQGISLTIRNAAFETISRQKQLRQPTFLMRDLSKSATELLLSVWKFPNPIRMMTITAIHLCPVDQVFRQDSFFADAMPQKTEKLERLETTMDQLRARFGSQVIAYGNLRPSQSGEEPLEDS